MHRWVGLAIAGFLFVSGLTRAVISWDHELDEGLNGDLIYVDGEGVVIWLCQRAACRRGR